MKQATTSKETSRPQISRGITLALKAAPPWMQTILDFGCGCYTFAEAAVREAGHVYLPFDPYNRREDVNRFSLQKAFKHCDFIVCSNVLNVLTSTELIHSVLAQIELIADSNTQIIFTIWEGNGSGKGEYTRNGFQQNQKLTFYLELIEDHFSLCEVRNRAIYARK